MSRNWIQAFSGKGVTPLELKVEQVVFDDIPHALSQKTRFNGHLREFYSVAQHCTLGAEQLRAAGKSVELQLAFHLHECSEVYLPDVPAPIKKRLFIYKNPNVSFDTDAISWEELEDQHALVMFTALGLRDIYPLIHSDIVKAMDRSMLITEKRDLRGPDIEPQVIAQENERYSGEPLDIKIESSWAPFFAKERFTALYWQLRKELGR